MIKRLNLIADAIYDSIPDPNDLWYLELTGRRAYHRHNIYGQGINVAVIDSGITPHPELGDRLLGGIDCCRTLSNSTVDDIGHGSHVAGLIAGKTCGVAPQANVIPFKCLNGMSEGYVDWMIDAFRQVLSYHKTCAPIDIVNISMCCDESTPQELIDQLHEAVKAVVDTGIPVVAAAGNTYSTKYLYPAAFQEVITVAAVSSDLKHADFSTSSNEVDFCQVGVDLISCLNRDNKYVVYSGTSMAAPVVTGILALMLCSYKEQFKKRMPEQALYEAARLHTVDVDAAGVDPRTGAGFLTLSSGLTVMELTPESDTIIVNGTPLKTDAPLTMRNDRIEIPARFVTENTSGVVFWDGVQGKARLIY